MVFKRGNETPTLVSSKKTLEYFKSSHNPVTMSCFPPTTIVKEEYKPRKCDSCGAPLTLINGKCEYCGTIYDRHINMEW